MQQPTEGCMKFCRWRRLEQLILLQKAVQNVQGCHWVILSNLCLWRMQQPTWAWQKTCRQRMRHIFLRQMQQPNWMWQKTYLAWFVLSSETCLAPSELLSEMWWAHSRLSYLILLCRSPFGIAMSQSTHHQRTIGFAVICLSNAKTLIRSPQICEQVEITTPMHLSQNLLHEFIFDGGLFFHLWRYVLIEYPSLCSSASAKPATGLRLVNACARLANRNIANRIKNFERAVIAFNDLLIRCLEWCPIIFLKMQSDYLLV